MSSVSAQRLGSNIPPVSAKRQEFVKIVLEDSDKIPPTGQFFGLNGRTWMLRAGEEARVPIGIIDILDNAVEAHPIKDGSNRVVGYRNRHRFPYRVIREEVEA
jgi:hypothetical protein